MPLELGSFSLGAVAGGVAVGFFNHYLAKSRDEENRTAKDFNEIADPLSVILENERDAPSTLGNIDFTAFRRVLSERELKRFNACVAEYEKAKENSSIVSDSGNFVRLGGSYKDTSEIAAAVDKLLKFTKRR
jgi:hypothetical protein